MYCFIISRSSTHFKHQYSWCTLTKGIVQSNLYVYLVYRWEFRAEILSLRLQHQMVFNTGPLPVPLGFHSSPLMCPASAIYLCEWWGPQRPPPSWRLTGGTFLGSSWWPRDRWTSALLEGFARRVCACAWTRWPSWCRSSAWWPRLPCNRWRIPMRDCGEGRSSKWSNLILFG